MEAICKLKEDLLDFKEREDGSESLPIRLADFLVHLNNEGMEDMANTIGSQLLDFYSIYTKDKRFVRRIFKKEIELAKNKNEASRPLFRGTCPATIFLSLYFFNRGPGSDYLRALLTPTLTFLRELENKKQLEPISEKNGTTSAFRKQSLADREEILISVEMLLSTFCESVDKFPPEVHHLLTSLHSALEVPNPSLVSSLICLRFITPCLISPHLYQLAAECPSEATRSALVQISKHIQSIFNHSVPLNLPAEETKFFNVAIEKLSTFMDKFLTWEYQSSTIEEGSNIIFVDTDVTEVKSIQLLVSLKRNVLAVDDVTAFTTLGLDNFFEVDDLLKPTNPVTKAENLKATQKAYNVEIFKQIRTDLGIPASGSVPEIIEIHKTLPELLAAVWCIVRECLVVDHDLSRDVKDIIIILEILYSQEVLQKKIHHGGGSNLEKKKLKLSFDTEHFAQFETNGIATGGPLGIPGERESIILKKRQMSDYEFLEDVLSTKIGLAESLLVNLVNPDIQSLLQLSAQATLFDKRKDKKGFSEKIGKYLNLIQNFHNKKKLKKKFLGKIPEFLSVVLVWNYLESVSIYEKWKKKNEKKTTFFGRRKKRKPRNMMKMKSMPTGVGSHEKVSGLQPGASLKFLETTPPIFPTVDLTRPHDMHSKKPKSKKNDGKKANTLPTSYGSPRSPNQAASSPSFWKKKKKAEPSPSKPPQPASPSSSVSTNTTSTASPITATPTPTAPVVSSSYTVSHTISNATSIGNSYLSEDVTSSTSPTVKRKRTTSGKTKSLVQSTDFVAHGDGHSPKRENLDFKESPKGNSKSGLPKEFGWATSNQVVTEALSHWDALEEFLFGQVFGLPVQLLFKNLFKSYFRNSKHGRSFYSAEWIEEKVNLVESKVDKIGIRLGLNVFFSTDNWKNEENIFKVMNEYAEMYDEPTLLAAVSAVSFVKVKCMAEWWKDETDMKRDVELEESEIDEGDHFFSLLKNGAKKMQLK